MTNKDIMYDAFVKANEAYQIALELQTNAKRLFSKDTPLVKGLQEITGLLDSVSDIHYDLGGGCSIESGAFREWLSDEREFGPCKDCANRTSTDSNGFHQCAMHRGHMSRDYCCYDFKPNTNGHEQKD